MINQKNTHKKSRHHKKRKLRLKRKFKRMLIILCTFLACTLIFSIVIFLPYPSEAQHLHKSDNKATIFDNNRDVSLSSEENTQTPTINAALNADHDKLSQDTESSQKDESSTIHTLSTKNEEPTKSESHLYTSAPEATTAVQEPSPAQVPLSSPVENDYFNETVFIGDSRTEGFCMLTDIANAKAYAHVGLTVDTVFTEPVITINGAKLSIVDALRQTSFQRVYVMLGLNETGWAYNSIFVEKYKNLVDEIKNINPNATIYLQSILPVSNDVSTTHDYINNEKINEYNRLIAQIATEKNVSYLNVAESVAAPNGALPDDAAVDGIHLKKEYCQKWYDYLKTHTISN